MRRPGPEPAVPSGLLVVVMSALWSSSICAQDELLKDLFPGVELSKRLPNAETDLYASAYSQIESEGKEYVALTYYQPYPNSPRLRYVNFALLERAGGEYQVRFDLVATDDGSGLEFQKPFLYSVDAADLVVFPSCYRGCRYSFFRLDTTSSPVTVEVYSGLDADESLSGTGDTYRFDASGLSATFNVERNGDASCCPSGGTVDVFYELRGDQFRIWRVERNESVRETR